MKTLQTFTLPGLRKYRLIIRGPLQAAVDAAGLREHGPLRNVKVDGYGSIHATLKTEHEKLSAWWRDVDSWKPGALLFYISDDQRREIDA